MSTAEDRAISPAGQRLISLHGRDLAVSEYPGAGVPLLLVHGLGSSTRTWLDVPGRLAAAGAHVIAVDLPGHGESSKLPGDYSLGAMANSLRDLLDHLGIARAHFVGHSLGGGVTMQFHYQFPERIASIALVSSGGLGEEIFPVLRAASLPGADLVIRAAINNLTLNAAAWLGRQLARVHVEPHALSPGALETAGWLGEPDHRAAFLSTVRSVLGPAGQRVSALDKLHLLSGEDVLIIWGDKDPMIPMHHGERAHSMIPGSRLVIFPGAGHEPHMHDPERFATLILEHARAVEALPSD